MAKRINRKKRLEIERKVRAEWMKAFDVIFDFAEEEDVGFDEWAEKACISPATLYRWYNGDFQYVHSDTFSRAIRALGLSLDLLGDCGLLCTVTGKNMTSRKPTLRLRRAS